MILELVLTALIPFSYALMWLWESRHPARQYQPIPGWGRLGVAFFVVVAVVGTVTPALLAASGVTTPRVFNLAPWGFWAFPVGMLVTSGVHYAWHRAMHASPWLWRAFHQLHHSPARVDMPGAFYSHPNEAAAKTTLNVLVATVVLGLDPLVAAAVATTLTLLNLLGHWNSHTPVWLGLLVARPEMHMLHHQADVHARNYADVALWDVLFGTFANPQKNGSEVPVGFTPARAARIRDMVFFKDVHGDAQVEPKGVAASGAA